MARKDIREGTLEKFRAYLRLLAEERLDPKLYPKVDPSDLVQETLIAACENLDRFRGSTDAELAAWLRTILHRNVLNTSRAFVCAKRDINREVRLEAALGRSSVKLFDFCSKIDPSPSSRISMYETILRLAEVIVDLPPDQKQALFLRHWRGYSLFQISREMNRTCPSVAGLLRRGLKTIREKMKNAG